MAHEQTIAELRAAADRALLNGHIYAAGRIQEKINKRVREGIHALIVAAIIGVLFGGWFYYGVNIFIGNLD